MRAQKAGTSNPELKSLGLGFRVSVNFEEEPYPEPQPHCTTESQGFSGLNVYKASICRALFSSINPNP